MDVRERLVQDVQALERLEEEKQAATEALANQFKAAKEQGYDTMTLRVVLKLRKLTPNQRRERRAPPEMTQPPLWADTSEALETINHISWPPTRAGKEPKS